MVLATAIQQLEQQAPGTTERILNAFANVIKEAGGVLTTVAAITAAIIGFLNRRDLHENTQETREARHEAQAAKQAAVEAKHEAAQTAAVVEESSKPPRA